MQVSGALVMAAAGAPTPTTLPQPTLQVHIGHDKLNQAILVTAVANNGAQASVAGVDLMHKLNLKQTDLRRKVQLRDVANHRVKSFGYYWCKIKVGDSSTHDLIHFVEDAKRCYLCPFMIKGRIPQKHETQKMDKRIFCMTHRNNSSTSKIYI